MSTSTHDKPFCFTADVRCFMESEFPGCSETHNAAGRALNSILRDTFERLSIPFVDEARFIWKDGGGHCCLYYDVPQYDPSRQNEVIQTFANMVEVCRHDENALQPLKDSKVYYEIEGNGQVRLSIAKPDEDTYNGTIVEPSPDAFNVITLKFNKSQTLDKETFEMIANKVLKKVGLEGMTVKDGAMHDCDFYARVPRGTPSSAFLAASNVVKDEKGKLPDDHPFKHTANVNVGFGDTKRTATISVFEDIQFSPNLA